MKPLTLSQALLHICEVQTIAGLMLFEVMLEQRPALYSAEALTLLRDMLQHKKHELTEPIRK